MLLLGSRTCATGLAARFSGSCVCFNWLQASSPPACVGWLGWLIGWVVDCLLDAAHPGLQVGVMWHVECGDGIFFPFSRGCSFITLTPDGHKIQTVRVDSLALSGVTLCFGRGHTLLWQGSHCRLPGSGVDQPAAWEALEGWRLLLGVGWVSGSGHCW